VPAVWLDQGMRVSGLAALVVATGCLSYGAGSFHDGGDPFVGRRVALDCADVAIAPTQDDRASGQVLAFTFGNHCSDPISIDFTKVRSVGRYADGQRELHAYDPKHELRALRLDAGTIGREEIAYAAADGSTPAAICVDVGTLETTERAPEHWVCFGEWDLGSAEPAAPTATEPALLHTPAATSSWPLPEQLEPEVRDMPSDAQASIASVGAYLAAHISDQRRLVKALHDYVVRRLSYDELARNATLLRPSQDANAVFERRLAVCEGYANLLAALGAAAGVDIRVVDGFVHSEAAPGTVAEPGELHAWNVAHVVDGWVLVDATWDDGDPSEISTQYLMTPPGVFARTHLPIESEWQLLAPELTLDEFLAHAWVR
jgi:Transglutaminase-like superfamily